MTVESRKRIDRRFCGVRRARLDADEVAKLDALAKASYKGSRRAALKYLVRQLPDPGQKKKA